MESDGRKWALVTGASPGGMGECEVMSLLKRGINVIATSIDAADVEDDTPPPPTSNDGLLVTLRMDVTCPASIAAVAERTRQLTDGKLDYLFNNAGFAYYTPLIDADVAKMKAQYDVNVFGLLAVTQAFFPLLRATRGTVVNQASLSGMEGYNLPFNGAYASSKAAVLSLSSTMRVELSPFNINVVTLITSAVKTKFFEHRLGGRLSETSPYLPIRTHVEYVMSSAEFDKRGHDREQVVEETIDLITKASPPVFIRKGYLAGMLTWTFWLLPPLLTDFLAVKLSGLDVLKRALLVETQNDKKVK